MVERNDLVDTKDQLIKEVFYLNNKDNKDKNMLTELMRLRE